MRKPHEHERNGVRFACSDAACRMPFKVGGAQSQGWMHPPKPRRKRREPKERVASREVQQARYLDAGPLNWDDV